MMVVMAKGSGRREAYGRVPRASELGPRSRKKLQTPYVFTQGTMSLPLEWVHLSSSRVMRARYDEGLQQIHVNFRDGTPWVYEDVPYDIYEMFVTADSPGRFINEVLDRYPYRRATALETMEW